MNSVEKMLFILNSGKISLNQLAKKTNLSSGHLTDIKNQKINPYRVNWQTVEKLAKFYNEVK